MENSRFLLICGSRKPAPGRESPSAARTMLRAVGEGVAATGRSYEWLDLRDLDLPFFDGRSVEEYDSPDLARLADAIGESTIVTLSVPAYWGGPAGVVKNALDCLGGAAYDAAPDRTLPLEGKIVAVFVVGADDVSAYGAASDIRVTLSELGAWVAPRMVVVGNPRHHPNPRTLLADLKGFGEYVASLEAAPVAVP
jgi:NAD(P)H-dependent FMN reductase